MQERSLDCIVGFPKIPSGPCTVMHPRRRKNGGLTSWFDICGLLHDDVGHNVGTVDEGYPFKPILVWTNAAEMSHDSVVKAGLLEQEVPRSGAVVGRYVMRWAVCATTASTSKFSVARVSPTMGQSLFGALRPKSSGGGNIASPLASGTLCAHIEPFDTLEALHD